MEEIAENTLPFERNAFLWLNDLHTDFWDVSMMTYSGKILWIPLAVLLLYSLFYKKKWTYAIWFIVCFAIMATLCDQLSASIVKPLFSRLRPTHHPDFMDYVQTVNNYRGGRFGFISAHATNGFGIATFMSLVYRYKWLTLTLFLWAIITCYSRIYLGVHFITDILGGMILGAVIGYLIYILFQYGRQKIFKETSTEILQPVYSNFHGNIIVAGIVITVIVNIAIGVFSIYIL